MGFMTETELEEAGFAYVGSGVQISRKASIYGASRISVGKNTRIDDFCVISAGEGGISIGAYCHIAVMCSVIGAAKITMEDFSAISARTAVYSSSDDYSGAVMTNPTVPIEYTDVVSLPVRIGRHALIGAGTVILPGVDIADGAAVGALSLVTKSLDEVAIYGGTPAKRLVERKTGMFDLEEKFLERGD